MSRSRRARAAAVPVPPKRRPEPESTLVGHTVEGKYQLTRVLGRGGMGTVYDATHRLTNRRVAVKVLLQEQAEKPDAIARFQHEARVVSGIGHPNICEILDFGRLPDGRPFLVMERLEGETLGQVLDRRVHLEVGEAVSIVRQVLAALGAAHERSVIHRDMKPDNVFLLNRAAGPVVAKVLDFGISKAMGDDREVELTRTGMVMGTPYYMAPEQARGDRDLDARVDVWAVGVLLYEALTGTRPFVAKNYNALLVEILTARHRPAAERNPKIPASLSAVIDRALAKKRDERFSSVAELSTALASFERVPAPQVISRPRVDRFVEVGGARIPVTWEDTGGETPPSDGGARIFDARALGLPLPPASAPAAAGAPAAVAPPSPVAPAAAAAPAVAPAAAPPAPTVAPAPRPAPPRAPAAPRAPGPAGAAPGGVRSPMAPTVPAAPPRPDGSTARPGFRSAPPPRGPAPAAAGRSTSRGSSEAGLRQSAGFRVPARPVATSRPPVIEDEDTTKVLADLESFEPTTPPPAPGWRGPGVAIPPAPPAAERARPGAGAMRPPASNRPPPGAMDDLEATFVDTEPPTFSSDAYRAHRERKE